ncbi:MAG: OmpA family protein [Nostocaceae cyanobacterium]|nr:OmpA family protein [Nostocaceae cyanobacterium]
MNEYSRDQLSKESPNNDNGGISNDDLNELRSLLFGVKPEKLNKIYERLDNPDINAEDISRLLPEAVVRSSMEDKLLGSAMVPAVEEAIQTSVKQDMNVLAEAIFPILAPAIRKAVSTALEAAIQSLNTTLEHSLSPQSFKWRLEAVQTGKSFAEVALLRSLVYRIEQVFLIHRETGLVMQHLVGAMVTAQDPSLVSAMLTAIQDFVKDSFNVQSDETLETLHFGELTIWIEQGPKAVLAGVIRGNAPQELRGVFQEALEKIHLKFSREIRDFSGDTEPFAASKSYLEPCLQTRYQEQEKKNFTYFWVALGIAGIALGTWSFFTIRDRMLWKAYVAQLNRQPGIVVINSGRRDGKYFISGMRDPLAIDPITLLQPADVNPKAVKSEWKPYLSFEPELTVKRAEQLLQPPTTVTLKVDDKGILYATGSAPQKWISESQKLARFIPGVTQFNEENLFDSELQALESYKQQIEAENIFFRGGSTELVSGEEAKLQNLVTTLEKLFSSAKSLQKNVMLQIAGHTDNDGTEQINMPLSQARAQVILNYINSQGIQTANFRTIGVGTNSPLRTGSTSDEKKMNRRVSFKVFLTDRKK